MIFHPKFNGYHISFNYRPKDINLFLSFLVVLHILLAQIFRLTLLAFTNVLLFLEFVILLLFQR